MCVAIAVIMIHMVHWHSRRSGSMLPVTLNVDKKRLCILLVAARLKNKTISVTIKTFWQHISTYENTRFVEKQR